MSSYNPIKRTEPQSSKTEKEEEEEEVERRRVVVEPLSLRDATKTNRT